MVTRYTCLRCRLTIEAYFPWQMVPLVREHERQHHGLGASQERPAHPTQETREPKETHDDADELMCA